MPTTEEILDQIDARLAQWLPVIESVQDNYIQTNGRYAQALEIVSQTPEDGATRAPDRLSDHPTDQLQSWQDLAPTLPPEVMSNIEIHTYHAPSGMGYVVVSEHVIDGATWQRSINYGPETWREQAWHEVE